MKLLRLIARSARLVIRDATLSLSIGFLLFSVLIGLSFGTSEFRVSEKQRSVLSSLCPAVARSSEGIARIDAVHEYAVRAGERFFVDPNLVLAVIAAESRCQPRAVSGAGAYGLMQLMPSTAREMGVENISSEIENVNGGAKYLAHLLKRFASIEHALAAYNAGPTKVRRYGGIPPYRETRRYVAQVMEFYQLFSGQARPVDTQEA